MFLNICLNIQQNGNQNLNKVDCDASQSSAAKTLEEKFNLKTVEKYKVRKRWKNTKFENVEKIKNLETLKNTKFDVEKIQNLKTLKFCLFCSRNCLAADLGNDDIYEIATGSNIHTHRTWHRFACDELEENKTVNT